jgi:Oxidoreductase family, NAD-binding Rossmann fold
MIRVGMVDLSTSHPGIFAPLLDGLGWPVTAVLEPVEARAQAFVEQHPGVVVADSLDELAGLCDVVMLLGADWDERIAQVKALTAHEIPIFVDKPMAGTAGELTQLAAMPVRLDGGSALRVAPEAVRVRDSGPPPATVDVSCAGHPFYYGVHAVALATAVLGPGLVAARGESDDLNQSITGVVRHVGGAEIRVAVSAGGPAGGFRATPSAG